MSRNACKNCSLILVVFLLGALLCACGAAAPEPAAQAQPPAPVAQTAALPAPQPPAATAAPAETPLPPAATETPAATPEPFSPLLPQGEPVTDDYFADSAFLGNSLVCGLKLYGGLENADFYAMTSTSVINIGINEGVKLANGEDGTLLEALFEKQYGKIYILLGINEISFEPEYFIELYGKLLDKIEENEPDAEIFIMGLTPVTEKKSGEGDLFSMARITRYNEALLAFAEARGCYYVDLVEPLADENGYLAGEASSDGIHLMPEKYPAWADCLRTHHLPQETA